MSLVSINDVLKITTRVEKIHPYKVVGNRDSYSPYNEGWSDCVSLIESYLEKLPSAEPERKWIPVSEKLPKVRTDVLLAFEKNMTVGFYSHGCWNVNTGNGFYTGVFTDEDKPIAWMPLPEKWRGE